MNKRQKMQLVLAVIAAVLLIFWLVYPVQFGLKVLGILSNALPILSMVLSYRAEEKMKKG